MKAKAVLMAAVAGLLLLTGGVMTDTGVSPTAGAAPVPRDFKPLPREAWGDVKDGLQAGLRMPAGATVALGQSAEIQVVVRNVGKLEREVWYTPQQPGESTRWEPNGERQFRLVHPVVLQDRIPRHTKAVLKPGEEFIRWTARVRHIRSANGPALGEVDDCCLDLPTGTHKLVMERIDNGQLGDFTAKQLGRLATGELEVRLPQPVVLRAPVPKDAAKAVLWSEPVRVDWKPSRAESVSGAWAPDGKSVLVPSPTLDEKGEPLPGGVDFRDAVTGKVTMTLKNATENGYQVTAVASAPDGKTLFAVGSLFQPRWKALPSRCLFAWRKLEDGGVADVSATAGAPDGLLKVSADGKQFATLAADGGARCATPGPGGCSSLQRSGKRACRPRSPSTRKRVPSSSSTGLASYHPRRRDGEDPTPHHRAGGERPRGGSVAGRGDRHRWRSG